MLCFQNTRTYIYRIFNLFIIYLYLFITSFKMKNLRENTWENSSNLNKLGAKCKIGFKINLYQTISGYISNSWFTPDLLIRVNFLSFVTFAFSRNFCETSHDLKINLKWQDCFSSSVCCPYKYFSCLRPFRESPLTLPVMELV